MLSQSIDQLLPVLQMIGQPAFCIRQDGTVVSNRNATALAPYDRQALPQWLGAESAELFDRWNGTDDLVLPVPLGGQTASVTVQALSDGTLFLLSQCTHLMAGTDTLAVTAQVLRQPLADLSGLTQRLSEELEDMEDPLLQEQTAAINRQIYRLSRIACNLADLDRLRNGAYIPCLEKLDLTLFLQELTQELEDICQTANRELHCKLPANALFLTADPMLLERALLNLISNALKYGQPGTPIHLRVDTTATAVLLQVQNTCEEESCDLLRAGFQRMEQRGVLPDPQWGVGLGLPMVRYIAQLMGGAVAMEVSRDGVATVTMSISRKRSLTASSVQTPPPFDYTGGMKHSLLELSDSLPNSCFDSVSL